MNESEYMCYDKIYGTLDSCEIKGKFVELAIGGRFYVDGLRANRTLVAGLANLSPGALRGRVAYGGTLKDMLTTSYSKEWHSRRKVKNR